MRKLVISVYANDPIELQRVCNKNYPVEYVQQLSQALDVRLQMNLDDMDIPL